MNSIVKKNVLITFYILLFLIEVLMIYLIIKSILTKDLISPHEVTFYEYLKSKLRNLI